MKGPQVLSRTLVGIAAHCVGVIVILCAAPVANAEPPYWAGLNEARLTPFPIDRLHNVQFQTVGEFDWFPEGPAYRASDGSYFFPALTH